jgi:hypothetical protein
MWPVLVINRAKNGGNDRTIAPWLPIDLDRAVGAPLATQIYRAVGDAIETDRLDPGAKLPYWRDMVRPRPTAGD